MFQTRSPFTCSHFRKIERAPATSPPERQAIKDRDRLSAIVDAWNSRNKEQATAVVEESHDICIKVCSSLSNRFVSHLDYRKRRIALSSISRQDVLARSLDHTGYRREGE